MSNTHLWGIQIGSRCRRSKILGGFESGIAYEFGTLENLNQATVTEICQIKDIGAAKATQIKAPLEVEKRIASKPKGVKIKLKSSQVFVEKFFSFSKKSEKGNCKDHASGSQTTTHYRPGYIERKLECQHCSPQGAYDLKDPGICHIIWLDS